MSDTHPSETEASGNEYTSPELPIPPELIKDIPEDKRAELIQFVSELSYVQHFSGPLPPPSLLNQYDQGVQRTIVNEAVENRKHRTGIESVNRHFSS